MKKWGEGKSRSVYGVSMEKCVGIGDVRYMGGVMEDKGCKEVWDSVWGDVEGVGKCVWVKV